MPNNDASASFPCPVCNDCDHDLRSGLLDLTTNIMDNFKAATETLLDAMEAEGSGAGEFVQATIDMAKVQHQISVLLDTIPEIATIKAAHA